MGMVVRVGYGRLAVRGTVPFVSFTKYEYSSVALGIAHTQRQRRRRRLTGGGSEEGGECSGGLGVEVERNCVKREDLEAGNMYSKGLEASSTNGAG